MRQAVLAALVALGAATVGRGDDKGAVREAKEFVEKAGGTLWKKDNKPDGPFDRVVFSDPKQGDDGLELLAGLEALEWVDVRGTRVTDAGVKKLAALKSLQVLDLSRTRVTDAGLRELSAAGRLEGLLLSGTAVTDAGMSHLTKVNRLQTLVLATTAVTDAGLKELAGIKTLTKINISGCKGVTDSGVDELTKALPKCEVIR